MKRQVFLRNLSSSRFITTWTQGHVSFRSIAAMPAISSYNNNKYNTTKTTTSSSDNSNFSYLQHGCYTTSRMQNDIRRCFASSPKKNKKKAKSKSKAKGNQGITKNKKQKQNQQQRPPRMRKDTLSTANTEAPPLFLYSTASPHVYVSSVAIDNMNEYAFQEHEHYDSDEEYEPIQPKSFFSESSKPPHSFTNSSFEYISPKVFKHELPTNPSVPEVAVLGRSNVGKSSLLNAITGNPQLARISKTPGRTQQVNYFGQFLNSSISGGSRNSSGNSGGGGGFGGSSSSNGDVRDINSTPPFGYLIDLPGYGYAQAPDELVDQWQKNTQDFIIARKEFGTLERLYMLIDSKRGIGVIDSTIMGWLDDANVNYTVVLTKSDSTVKPMLIKCANEICMRYYNQMMNDSEAYSDDGVGGCQSPFVHVTSSRKGIGVNDLMYAIEGDFHGFRLNHSQSLKK